MKTLFNIISTSRYGIEVIDTAEGLFEARRLAKEYQMAFGNDFCVHYKRK
jgi:hypothetical protein